MTITLFLNGAAGRWVNMTGDVMRMKWFCYFKIKRLKRELELLKPVTNYIEIRRDGEIKVGVTEDADK